MVTQSVPVHCFSTIKLLSLTFSRFAALLLLLGLSNPTLANEIASTTAARTLDDWLNCAQSNFPESSAKERIELVKTDRLGGSRTLIGDLFWSPSRKQESRLLLKLDQPSELKGAAYLVLEHETSDEMYMYLPSFNRVRRIVGKSRNQSLWGTDFSYNDIKQMKMLFSRRQSTLGDAEVIDGRVAYPLHLTPDPEDESAYQQIVSWIDEQTCLLLRADFYGQKNRISKQLSTDGNSFKKIENKHYASRYRMQNMIDETQTELHIIALEYDLKLKSHYFHRKTFFE